MAEQKVKLVPQTWVLESITKLVTASETAKDLFAGKVSQQEVFDVFKEIKIPEEPLSEEEALQWGSKIVAKLTQIKITKMNEEIKEHGKERGISPIAAAVGGMVGSSILNAILQPIISAAITKPISYWSNSTFKPEILAINDLTSAWLRGEISEGDFVKEMHKHGFKNEKIDIIKRLAFWLPSPPDLIRLAVREAFAPREQLKIHAEGYKPPDAFLEWGRKQGLSPEWAERFWHAHWQLPSPTQVLEMFHRKVITREQMMDYLKVLDYYKDDAERLAAISYNVPTRVDLRRMYRAGVLTYDELVDYYEKLGYSPEDAQKICTWIKMDNIADERDLTKTEIAKAVQIGEITKEEATKILTDMGYSEDEADILVTTYISAGKTEQRELTRTMIENSYRYGLITKSEAMNMLIGQGWSSQAAEQILKLVDLKKSLELKTLPFGYMRDLYKEGYIEEEEFRDYLAAEGYISEHIDLVIARETARKKKGEE